MNSINMENRRRKRIIEKANGSFESPLKLIKTDEPTPPKPRAFSTLPIGGIYATTMADVNFVFAGENHDILVPAHRCMLAHRSSIFREMFFGESNQKEGDIRVDDATVDEFVLFLKMFYGISITLNEKNIHAITYLTHKYDMKYCKRDCEYFLGDALKCNVEAVFWVLPMAIRFNYALVRTDCEATIHTYGRQLIESTAFGDCDQDTLRIILSKSNERNEKDVFDKCIKWVENACVKAQLDPNSQDDVRKQLGDCFNLIRFDQMSTKQFVECLSEHLHVFYPDELKTIAKTISTNSDSLVVGHKTISQAPVQRPTYHTRPFNFLHTLPLHEMYECKDIADVYFTFGNSKDSSHMQIAAHKCVLALMCPTFENLFKTMNNSNTIRIQHSTAEEFNLFLMSLYTSEFKKHLTLKNIDGIMRLIQNYKPNSSMPFNLCQKFLILNMHDNLFPIYELSRKYSLTDLYSACARNISANVSQTLSTNEFLNLNQSNLMEILQIDFRNEDANIVCDAGLTWAKQFSDRSKMNQSNENLRRALGDAFALLPFAKMDPLEFIDLQRDYGSMFTAGMVKRIIDEFAKNRQK